MVAVQLVDDGLELRRRAGPQPAQRQRREQRREATRLRLERRSGKKDHDAAIAVLQRIAQRHARERLERRAAVVLQGAARMFVARRVAAAVMMAMRGRRVQLRLCARQASWVARDRRPPAVLPAYSWSDARSARAQLLSPLSPRRRSAGGVCHPYLDTAGGTE